MTTDPFDYITELREALAEAIQTIEIGHVLGQGAVSKRVEKYRVLLSLQGPITGEKPRAAAIHAYIDQLETIARRLIDQGGPLGHEARLIISPENIRALGLSFVKTSTGKIRLATVVSQASLNLLDAPCPLTASGQHENFREGRRLYCRACGAERLLKPGE